MKRKLFPALAAVLILALALAGCAPQTAQAEYIGIDAAKTIALEAIAPAARRLKNSSRLKVTPS